MVKGLNKWPSCVKNGSEIYEIVVLIGFHGTIMKLNKEDLML